MLAHAEFARRPQDMNHGRAAFPAFHSVYISPNASEAYGKTGKFPDGTVLIKELVNVGVKRPTSENGYFMSDFTGKELLMKPVNRFKNEPGHWGFFRFVREYSQEAASTVPRTANCNACHEGAADDNFVFTQYYPVLRAAQAQR